MLLTDIEAALQEIDPRVYYGMVDETVKDIVWNYTVFNRTAIKHSSNRTSASDYFDVHIIRENYIPEGIDTEIIDKLCELPGVRLSGSDSEFNYVQKPNTNIVVEMLTIHFLRARKA